MKVLSTTIYALQVGAREIKRVGKRKFKYILSTMDIVTSILPYLPKLKNIIDIEVDREFYENIKSGDVINYTVERLGIFNITLKKNISYSKSLMDDSNYYSIIHPSMLPDSPMLTGYATFRDYYNQKMSEGRSHYNALGHCAGKLVRIIYKMLSDDVPFNLA